MQRLGIKRCALFFIIPHRWLSLWSWSWPGPQLTAIGAQHLAWIAAAICKQTFFVLLAEMPYIQIRFGNPAPTRLETRAPIRSSRTSPRCAQVEGLDGLSSDSLLRRCDQGVPARSLMDSYGRSGTCPRMGGSIS